MAPSSLRPPGPASHRVELDAASALPALPSILHDVRILLESNGHIGIIALDLEPLSLIESECGSAIYNEVLARVSAEVGRARSTILRASELLCSIRPYGEQIALFLDTPRETRAMTSELLEGVADRVWLELAPRVLDIVRPFGLRSSFHLGYSVVLQNPLIQTERLIYRALDQALVIARDRSRRAATHGREQLRDLIISRALTSVFQPIVDVTQNQVRAWEALVRGPSASELETPARLFSLAGVAGLVSELDRACCECALSRARDVPDGRLLFVNVLPALMNDANFRARMVDEAGIEPHRLVLELNESAAIHSYDVLARAIAELRGRGVRVAVDDLGAGYANLEHIVQLRPDFLKLDIHMTRGIQDSVVKQAMVASMVTVGRAVGATVIAEGIETAQEYETVKRLGIEWGQGYYFARPAPRFDDGPFET